MKGVFLEQPLEVRVEVKGEEFRQGDSLPCMLSMKNHGTAPIPLTGACLMLAAGDLKKVKQKAEDAFEVIAEAEVRLKESVAPQQTESFSCSFQLDRNCPITDKSGSLFLLYGGVGTKGTIGQLLVTVQPYETIRSIIEQLESSFQFVFKDTKSSDGWVEARFKSPSTRQFSMLDELLLGFQFAGETLKLRYSCKVKKFESGTSSLGVKKGKELIERSLEPGQYLLPGGFINPEAIDREVQEALSGVMVA